MIREIVPLRDDLARPLRQLLAGELTHSDHIVSPEHVAVLHTDPDVVRVVAGGESELLLPCWVQGILDDPSLCYL